MKKIIFLLLLLIIIIPAYAKIDKKDLKKAPSYEIVEAEGSASINNNDYEHAKDEAVLAAQKKAIETVVGCFVDSKTLGSNFTELEEEIITKSEGYIEDYEIIKGSERTRDIDGFKSLYIKIKAKVWVGKIFTDLSSISNLYEKLDKPKFAIIISENNNIGANLTGELNTKIVNQLRSLNFIVVDTTLTDLSNKSTLYKTLKENDIKILLTVNADTYVNTVNNKLKTKSGNINIPINSAQCSMSINFIDLTTGHPYYTDTIIGHTGFDQNPMGMAVSSIKDAVNKFFAPKYLDIIKAELCNKWIELYNNHILYIKIKNIRYKDIKTFINSYKEKDRFFINYSKIKFESNTASFEITTKNYIQTCIEYIDSIKINDKSICVTDVNNNEIIATME